MLKKFLIGTFAVAALAFAMSAQAYDFGSVTLRVGSKGAAVMAVQTVVGASVDGSYGPMTAAAVKAWQAANGLAADGVFGPMSMAKANGAVSGNFPAGCTSAAGYSSTTGQKCDATPSTGLPAGCMSTAGYSATTGAKCDGGSTPAVDNGPLTGTAGEISTVNQLSQYSAEEVGAGQDDVKVLGFEVKATKDGDIGINSAKVSFVITNTSGSTKLADYADSVSVWQGSTKIGSADADDFNKDSTGHYSKTIAVSNSVVRAGDTEKFYVTIDALGNLDSDDINSEVMTIGVDSVRFIDGSGVVTTDATAGVLPLSGVSVAFVSFSTAADTELKISLDNTPVASVVKASTTANTEDVVLLKGKMKLEGNSDAWLDSMPFTLVTVGGTTIDDVAANVTLKLGDSTYTESLGANCATSCATQTTDVVTFDNLDYDIEAGDTVKFEITANINDINAGAFAEGDSLSASLLTTNRDDIVIENEEGDQLTDATEMTGSAIGEAQAFRSTGINATLVSTNAIISHTGDIVGSGVGDDDQATFTIVFDVEAFNSDVYVDATAPSLTGAGAIMDLNLVTTGTVALTSAVLTSDATLTGTPNADARYKVAEGDTERFTLTVISTVSADGLAYLKLDDIVYALTDVTGTTSYTTNLTNFKTANIYMNAN